MLHCALIFTVNVTGDEIGLFSRTNPPQIRTRKGDQLTTGAAPIPNREDWPNVIRV